MNYRQPIGIRELSFALAHRWQPERLFMFVYTGYLDESGTHDDSAITVMGGLLARADQWQKFEDGFAAAQKRFGFRVWHTKKFKRRTGDFKGWSDVKCSALYWHLQKLTGYGLTDSITTTLDNAEYETHYRLSGRPVPRRARFDTKYGLCFRFCLYYFAQEVFKRRHRKKIPHLHIVLEAGHRHYGDAERIFLEIKRDFERGGIFMLRTITKAEKGDCSQLMIADFTAHSEYLAEGRVKAGQHKRPSPSVVPKGMTGITHAKLTPEKLAQMRAEILEKATPKKGPNVPVSAEVAASERPLS